MPLFTKYRFFLFTIVLHVFGFVLAIKIGGIYTKDSFEYLHQSFNLFKNGSWYAADLNAAILPDYFSFRPPLYAAFIGVIKFFLPTDYAVLFAQNMLSIGNIFLVRKFYLTIRPDATQPDNKILWLLVLYPTQILLANMVMSEIVFQSLLLWLCWFCYRFYEQPKFLYTVFIGVMLSLLVLTKPVALLLIVPVLVWIGYVLIYATIPKIKRVIYLLPLVMLPLTIHAIALQQKHQTGFYHYSSMLPFNQFKFHARFILAHKYGETFAENWTDSTKKKLNLIPDYATRYASMKSIGDSVILSSPIDFAFLYLRGCMAMLLDPGRFEIATFLQITESSNGLFYEINAHGVSAILNWMKNGNAILVLLLGLLTLSNIVISIFLTGLIWQKKLPFAMRFLLLLVIGYLVMATGMLGVARYRSAIFPEICLAILLLTPGMVSIFNKLKRKNV